MKYTLKNKEIELTDEEVKEIVKQSSKSVEEKKVGIQIKNRFTGDIIFTSTKTNWKEAVEEAVSENANLYNADLKNANLYNANLENANLYNTDLKNADLCNADLYNADLKNANLYNANLKNANLYNANLYNANLENADLYNADLKNANLYNAKFYGKGGTIKLKKEQVPVFLKALGFIIED